MAENSPSTTMVSVRLRTDLHDLAKREADIEDRSFSSIVNRAVRHYFASRLGILPSELKRDNAGNVIHGSGSDFQDSTFTHTGNTPL